MMRERLLGVMIGLVVILSVALAQTPEPDPIWRNIQPTQDASVPLPRFNSTELQGVSELPLLLDETFNGEVAPEWGERLTSYMGNTLNGNTHLRFGEGWRFTPDIGYIANFLIETRVKLRQGQFKIFFHASGVDAYQCQIKANGRVNIYRSNELVAFTKLDDFKPKKWLHFACSMSENKIQVSVGDTIVLEWFDDAPLAPGLVMIESSHKPILLDSFKLHGNIKFTGFESHSQRNLQYTSCPNAQISGRTFYLRGNYSIVINYLPCLVMVQM